MRRLSDSAVTAGTTTNHREEGRGAGQPLSHTAWRAGGGFPPLGCALPLELVTWIRAMLGCTDLSIFSRSCRSALGARLCSPWLPGRGRPSGCLVPLELSFCDYKGSQGIAHLSF